MYSIVEKPRICQRQHTVTSGIITSLCDLTAAALDGMETFDDMSTPNIFRDLTSQILALLTADHHQERCPYLNCEYCAWMHLAQFELSVSEANRVLAQGESMIAADLATVRRLGGATNQEVE